MMGAWPQGVLSLHLENAAGYRLWVECSCTCVYGLGLFSSTGTGLRYVALIRGFPRLLV